MRKTVAAFSGLLVVLAALSSSTSAMTAEAGPSGGGGPEGCGAEGPRCFVESTIAFTSTRDDPSGGFAGAEVYLMNPDGTDPRRLTSNTDGDGFPVVSPDGREIAFDSNRSRLPDEAVNTSDLFVMNADGSDQTLVARGSSATWSPDGKAFAFHASASYYASGGLVSGSPIRASPGSATTDSDLFVLNTRPAASTPALGSVPLAPRASDELFDRVDQPTNLTNTAHDIEDDADWKPDGTAIVFTSHPDSDNKNLSNKAEIYVIDADGTGRAQLTQNTEEERGPAWSPDGGHIVFSCRIGGGSADFEICVMNANGGGVRQLTDNTAPDLTPTWSPDGERILFHSTVAGEGQQLFVINANGSQLTKLTSLPGMNNLASWGELRAR